MMAGSLPVPGMTGCVRITCSSRSPLPGGEKGSIRTRVAFVVIGASRNYGYPAMECPFPETVRVPHGTNNQYADGAIVLGEAITMSSQSDTRQLVPDLPERLLMDLHGDCNLKCPMCFRHGGISREEKAP